MNLPANWKTSLFGAVTMGSLFIVANPDLITGVIGNEGLSRRLFSVAALISGYIAFSQAKDKNVTGGAQMQDVNGAKAPNTNLTRATLDVTPIDKR